MENCDSECKTNTQKSEFNCSFLESMPTSIKNIISWRCPFATGSIMAAWIALSMMVKFMSFISVVAYLGLLFILSSMVFRFYANFVNNEARNPLQEVLDKDVKVYLTRIAQIVQHETDDDSSCLNSAVYYLRDIFLLNSYVDALKFFLANLALVYVGMLFNLLDLVSLLVLALLTGPKIYSLYRVQIDDAVHKVRGHAARLLDIAREKMATLPLIGTGKPKQI